MILQDGSGEEVNAIEKLFGRTYSHFPSLLVVLTSLNTYSKVYVTFLFLHKLIGAKTVVQPDTNDGEFRSTNDLPQQGVVMEILQSIRGVRCYQRGALIKLKYNL
jgi:hypothetical protein